jgi:FkbM family methyltransferase
MSDTPDFAELIKKSSELCHQLKVAIGSTSTSQVPTTALNLTSVEVVITPNEVNERHGTGVLVRRLFPNSSNVVSVRSVDTYAGDHSFGVASFRLTYPGMSRAQVFAEVAQNFSTISVNRVLCVPLYRDDVLTAIALKELFNVPLCTYLMDDQNIYSDAIPDDLMRELLTKSLLRLTISPEMRDAYEKKFFLKFWVLPPLISSELLPTQISTLNNEALKSKTGILIGNVWSQLWLDSLRKTIRESSLTLDWFGNNSSQWLQGDRTQLQADGIFDRGFLPDEAAIVQQLQQYPYAVVPSSALNQDHYEAIGKLSLPSRIPFILATSNTPIIVLGGNETAAAQFVDRFGVGVVCSYQADSFRQAVDYVCAPEQQASMRQKAAHLASSFVVDGIGDWIWQSLELGRPVSYQFEDLFPRRSGDLIHYIEPPAPADVFSDFVPVYLAMQRLIRQGFQPDFVLDVGSSVGVWSHVISKLLPATRFILIDPLMSKYSETLKSHFTAGHSNFELVEVAISNQSGEATFQVSPDLYGSSLLHPADFRPYESVHVEVMTLDDLAQEKALSGRGLLKIDVQCAEHLVLEGAKLLMSQLDVIVLELSLVRYDERAKDFAEMIQMLNELGFRYYDDVGCWRSPVDGTLLQKDVLFLRHELYVPETSRL